MFVATVFTSVLLGEVSAQRWKPWVRMRPAPAPAPVVSAQHAEQDNGLVCGGKDSGCDTMGIGDGDCDRDSDCHAGLVCGSNNCGDFRPSGGWSSASGLSWDTTDDCCMKPSGASAGESDNGLVCGGKDSGCDTMGIGDGDCDYDSDCHAGLVCGTNNCRDFRPSGGWYSGSRLSWDTTDDCCKKPNVASTVDSDNGLVCGGKDSGCDTMGIGDGDCDRDSDCHTGLVCGSNNCGDFRPSGGWSSSSSFYWDTTDDCCYKPSASSVSAVELVSTMTTHSQNVFASIAFVLFGAGVAGVVMRQRQRVAPRQPPLLS